MKTSTTSPHRPLRDELSGIWTWIKQRRLLVGSAVIAMLGLALGWNWLATAGLLPFLVFLPCVLMMGMCMKGMGSSKTGNVQDKQDESPTGSSSSAPPSALLPAGSSHQRNEEKGHE